jgi:hypothetical protein
LMTEMEHSPSSSDLALNDSFLFPKPKSALVEQRFQDIEDIIKMWNVMRTLIVVPQQEFQKSFQQWQHIAIAL